MGGLRDAGRGPRTAPRQRGSSTSSCGRSRTLLLDKRVAVLSFDAPYMLDETEISKLSVYIAAYSPNPPFVEAAVRGLFHRPGAVRRPAGPTCRARPTAVCRTAGAGPGPGHPPDGIRRQAQFAGSGGPGGTAGGLPADPGRPPSWTATATGFPTAPRWSSCSAIPTTTWTCALIPSPPGAGSATMDLLLDRAGTLELAAAQPGKHHQHRVSDSGRGGKRGADPHGAAHGHAPDQYRTAGGGARSVARSHPRAALGRLPRPHSWASLAALLACPRALRRSVGTRPCR